MAECPEEIHKKFGLKFAMSYIKDSKHVKDSLFLIGIGFIILIHMNNKLQSWAVSLRVLWPDPCSSSHLDILQVWSRSDRIVGDVDMKEGVELVVAAAQRRRDGLYAITPVQGIWVVEAKWPRRGLIFYEKVRGGMRWSKHINQTEQWSYEKGTNKIMCYLYIIAQWRQSWRTGENMGQQLHYNLQQSYAFPAKISQNL